MRRLHRQRTTLGDPSEITVRNLWTDRESEDGEPEVSDASARVEAIGADSPPLLTVFNQKSLLTALEQTAPPIFTPGSQGHGKNRLRNFKRRAFPGRHMMAQVPTPHGAPRKNTVHNMWTDWGKTLPSAHRDKGTGKR